MPHRRRITDPDASSSSGLRETTQQQGLRSVTTALDFCALPAVHRVCVAGDASCGEAVERYQFRFHHASTSRRLPQGRHDGVSPRGWTMRRGSRASVGSRDIAGYYYGIYIGSTLALACPRLERSTCRARLSSHRGRCMQREGESAARAEL